MTRRTTIGAVLVLAMVAGAPEHGAAQDDSVAALLQSQAAMVRRIFENLATASDQKQLFDLWMADLLLTSNRGPYSAVGIEDVVGAGGLEVLDTLSSDPNAEIAAAASALRTRLAAELDLSSATLSAASAIDLDTPRELRFGEYDEWLVLETRPDLEYRVQARGCPVLRAVAVGADRRRGLGGTIAFGSRFSFTGGGTDIAFLRIRTPFCDTDGTVTLSAALPTLPLPFRESAADVRNGAPLDVGRSYAARLDEGSQHWIRFDAAGGRRYVLMTTPDTDDVDTVLTVYDADGLVEQFSDDDSGPFFGSRIELNVSRDTTYLVKVNGLGNSVGGYELSIAARPTAESLARPVGGGPQRGELGETEEEWWRVPVQRGLAYVFETTPAVDVDTLLTVFASDGNTILGMNDDGGPALGSRVELTSDEDGTLLLQVRSVEGSRGAYTLTVTERRPPAEIARPLTSGDQEGELTLDESEQWWRLEAESGRRYVFETIPEGAFDSILALYRANGRDRIAEDDDGGSTSTGSKIDFDSDVAQTLFLRVTGYSGSTGVYRLVVTSTAR